MATLFDSVVTEGNIWKGAARLLYADAGTSFPGELESVINPTTFALQSGWNDFGGTTQEGVTITREFEGSDGVEVDQLAYAIWDGEPDEWSMYLAASLLETDPDNLAIVFELPAATDHAGSSVSQKHVAFSAPTSLTTRMIAAVQQHSENENLRVFVFREAKPTPDSRDLLMAKTEGTAVPIQFELEADTAVADADGPFGMLYRETYSG